MRISDDEFTMALMLIDSGALGPLEYKGKEITIDKLAKRHPKHYAKLIDATVKAMRQLGFK